MKCMCMRLSSCISCRVFLLPLQSFYAHSVIRHDLLLRYMSRNWALLHILQVEAPEQAWPTEAFLTFLKFRIVPQIIPRPLLSTSLQFIFSQSPCCHPAGAACRLFALPINKYRFVFPKHNSLLIIQTTWSHSDTPHTLGILWTSDQPDAQTSTWQNTTFTRDRQPCPRWDSSPQFQHASGRRPTP